MRQIKFRAWVPEGEWTENGEEQKHILMYDFAFEEYAPINEHLNSVEHLMQFTGLCDKNGVEIYEGDLLRIDSNYFKIEFSNGCFWGILYKNTDPTNKQEKHPLGQLLHYIFNDTICEVIGNILENPELLKDSE